MVINSLSSCLFRKVFHLICVDSFTRYRINGCQFSSFNILNTSSHCLPACNVSVEKLFNSLIVVTFYVTSLFSLVSFKFFSVFDFWLFIMHLGVDPSGLHLFEIFWVSWIWTSICLPSFGRFSAIINLNTLSISLYFSSPSGIPIRLIFFFLLCFVSLIVSPLF